MADPPKRPRNGNKTTKEISGARCAFCKRTDRELDALIRGLRAYICKDCVRQCRRLLKGVPEDVLLVPWKPAGSGKK